MDRALNILGSPLEWNKEFPIGKTSGLEWISGLPKPGQLVLNLYRRSLAGDFNKSLKGLLASPPPGGLTVEAWLSCDEMKGEWLAIEEALEELKGKGSAEGTEGEQKGKVDTEEVCSETEGKDSKSTFQKDVECRAAEYLSQRLICVYDFESSHGAFLGFTYTGGKITVHAANLEQTLQSIFLCFTSVFFTIRSHTLPRVFQTGVNAT